MELKNKSNRQLRQVWAQKKRDFDPSAEFANNEKIRWKELREGLDLKNVHKPAESVEVLYQDKGARCTKAMMTVASSSKTIPAPGFLEQNQKYRGHFLVEEHYNIKPEYGYWAVLPPANCDPTDLFSDEDGNTYIPVSLSALEWGVRFPTHLFFQQVLCHYNLSIFQIVPQSLRRIIGFIWVCEWFDFPLTLKLFKACFKCTQVNPGGGGFYAFMDNDILSHYPYVDSNQHWKEFYYLLRVPTAPAHPFRFYAPTYFTRVRSHRLVDPSELNDHELVAYRYFALAACVDAKKNPGTWMPYYDFVMSNRWLTIVGIDITGDEAEAVRKAKFGELGCSPSRRFADRLRRPLHTAPKLVMRQDDEIIKSRKDNKNFYTDPFDGSKKAKMRPPIPALPGDEEDKKVLFVSQT